MVVEEFLGVLGFVVECLGAQFLDGRPDFYLHLVFVVGFGVARVCIGCLYRDGIAV